MFYFPNLLPAATDLNSSFSYILFNYKHRNVNIIPRGNYSHHFPFIFSYSIFLPPHLPLPLPLSLSPLLPLSLSLVDLILEFEPSSLPRASFNLRLSFLQLKEDLKITSHERKQALKIGSLAVTRGCGMVLNLLKMLHLQRIVTI